MASASGSLNDGLGGFTGVLRGWMDSIASFQTYMAQGMLDFQEGINMITSAFTI